MKLDKDTIIQLLTITLVVGSSFTLGYLYDGSMDGFKQLFTEARTGLALQSMITDIEKQDIINNCNNSLGVKQFSECLVDNVKPFYIYNITKDTITISFQELKVRGGDCKEWSELYHELAKSSGYDSVLRRYNGIVDVKYGHQWTTIYNETDYCEIDLLKVNCWKAVETDG